MNKHIGVPGERLTLTVNVERIGVTSTNFGPVADHHMKTPDGDILFWAASSRSKWLTEGGTYTVRATVKNQDLDENGTPRTHLMRVEEHYEAPRVPRVAVGLSRGGHHRR